jgi:hypothetical protein
VEEIQHFAIWSKQPLESFQRKKDSLGFILRIFEDKIY